MMTRVCPQCQGSGKWPSGGPLYSGDGWFVPLRFIGWAHTTNGTAGLPSCTQCHGTGMVPLRELSTRRLRRGEMSDPRLCKTHRSSAV